MSCDAIFSAAPLTSKIFPSTAPRQMIKARPPPPKVLPTPASMDFNKASGCMPSNKPATMATMSRDKKGLIFFAVKNTCRPIAIRRMSRGMV